MQKGAFKFVQPLLAGLAGLAGWACSAGMLLLAANAFAQNATAPFTLTDDRGRVVVIEKAPQRVITLLPSLGEIVCELKACDLLVGVDRYSNWPERVKALPKLGGLDDTQLEALVKLKPDLVLQRLRERLGKHTAPEFKVLDHDVGLLTSHVNLVDLD